jgi:hypothetical protein
MLDFSPEMPHNRYIQKQGSKKKIIQKTLKMCLTTPKVSVIIDTSGKPERK